MKNKNILAIDFGGMSVKYFLINNNKELAHIVSDSRPLMERTKLIDDIKSKFADFENKHGKIEGIAMSFNSPVLEGKKVRWGAINGFWEYFDIKELLEKANVISANKITILNDAKSAGYAEMKDGAGKGYENVVMLTYGTAIGGAAFIGKAVVNGDFGLGAELSNPIMGWDGKDLKSVKLWCEYASMSFLENEYASAAGKRITGKEIFDLSDAGDKIAKDVTERLLMGVAIHVFNSCYTYGPSVIILGGGLSNRSTLAEEVEEKVREIEKHRGLLFPCKIVRAKLSNKAGAFGAYYYFLDQME